MTTRTAILFDERGNPIGQTGVQENTVLINHGDRLFVRSNNDGRRLAGGGIGVVFNETDPAIRAKLSPTTLR